MSNYNRDFEDDFDFDDEYGRRGHFEEKKFDNFFLGFFLSVLMTFVMLMLLSRDVLSAEVGLMENLTKVYQNMMFPMLMIASLFPSLFVFFYFYKTDKWRSGKGMVVAVLLSMVLVVLHSSM